MASALSDETPPETPAERQARLRAELLEREVLEKREALRAETRGYVDAQRAVLAHARALDEVLRAIKSGLPALVTIARLELSEREAVVAARVWWRELRHREADRLQAKAEKLPEFVPWRGPGA